MEPLVTIGICVRNCEKYIEETIDSLINQNFSHDYLELIIVDDGSEDTTLSIIKKCIALIDFPVKIIHTSWKGLGHARNLVVKNTHGEFILWVDGDMILSNNYVKILVEQMKKNPKVGILKGKLALIPGQNLLGTLESFSRAADKMIDYESEKGHEKSLGTGGSIYRIDVLKQTGGFDENLRGYGEDLDLEIRARKKGWFLSTTNAYMLDYERKKLKWNDLWKRYWLRGYYTRYFLQKNKGTIKHYKNFPIAAFINGFLKSLKLYKLTGLRCVFFLPFQYVFKSTAWYIGYLNSYK